MFLVVLSSLSRRVKNITCILAPNATFFLLPLFSDFCDHTGILPVGEDPELVHSAFPLGDVAFCYVCWVPPGM